jgi:hypothetical protein
MSKEFRYFCSFVIVIRVHSVYPNRPSHKKTPAKGGIILISFLLNCMPSFKKSAWMSYINEASDGIIGTFQKKHHLMFWLLMCDTARPWHHRGSCLEPEPGWSRYTVHTNCQPHDVINVLLGEIQLIWDKCNKYQCKRKLHLSGFSCLFLIFFRLSFSFFLSIFIHSYLSSSLLNLLKPSGNFTYDQV